LRFPRAAYPRPCSSNASGLHGRNSARIGESARAFKEIICDDVSEFESDMPSHAVGLSQVRNPTGNLRAPVEIIARAAPPQGRRPIRGRGCALSRPGGPSRRVASNDPQRNRAKAHRPEISLWCRTNVCTIEFEHGTQSASGCPTHRPPAVGGLFPLAQIAGAILLVRQPSPLARRVYQGIAWRSGWNHVRELQTISRKPPILVCPTRHAAVRWSR
jgi:hypothetical protein